MTAPPEAGLGRRRGWGLPHFGTKAEERQSPALLVTPPKAQRCDCRDQSELTTGAGSSRGVLRPSCL
jgi:hypothetical protein